MRPGDAGSSFEAFFSAERARLFGALVVMTGNRAEAEEILQDAFLKVWERWERVAVMEEPVGFLYRTAMNLFRKRLRRAAVAVRKAAHLLPRGDELAQIETRDEAVRLLRRLTPRERAAIVVTAYLGYSSEEAGELLGIQATTVRVLTNRARATLRGVEEVSG
ncbi:MAG TPA: sigma-70 family RNA polymerase sigma factor [Actinomycetota bacterium]